MYQEQKISTPFSVLKYEYNKSAMHTLQLIQSDLYCNRWKFKDFSSQNSSCFLHKKACNKAKTIHYCQSINSYMTCTICKIMKSSKICIKQLVGGIQTCSRNNINRVDLIRLRDNGWFTMAHDWTDRTQTLHYVSSSPIPLRWWRCQYTEIFKSM